MQSVTTSLIQKYNVACPRYTSYPTVPFWDKDSFSVSRWKELVHEAFEFRGKVEGLSVYIHLPYCESLCTYCGCNTRITVNHSVELPYINTLIKEWKQYVTILGDKPVIKELHLGGGTPTFFSANNLKFLLENIFSDAVVAENPDFSFEGHPANTTHEHLSTLFELGFRRVSFGIQDFDEKIQEVINRKQSLEQVKNVVTWAREIGYESINFDLVYGLPLQTIETVGDTIDKVLELKPDRIAFYSYAHVPWLKPGQRKFTELDLPDNETKRGLYDLGCSKFLNSGYAEIGMDHFSLKSDKLYKSLDNKSLNRNFMGYTDCKSTMLIGLGCSSISDIGTAYAQNAKTVEAYSTQINQNELAVFTGHIQTQEDMVLRKHINNLICKLETSWQNPKLQCDSLYKLVENYSEMILENLVELTDSGLKVTKQGKPFIRNICTILDNRLNSSKSTKELFSKSI